MIPFAQASAISQARRLRKLAQEVVKCYALNIKEIRYIHNGENATFQLRDNRNQKYLLRIHRYGYHSTAAIEEELRWLNAISDASDIPVPRPLKAKNGLQYVVVKHPAMSYPRHCAVFRWVEGQFLWKRTNEKYMTKLGELIAQLQKIGKKQEIQHRKYWSVEGLIGQKSKFGDLKKVKGIPNKQHQQLLIARDCLLKTMSQYEVQNPDKFGLMHADLHFGNFVVRRGNFGAIDFDDCGTGMYAYDLAISMQALEFLVFYEKRRDFDSLRNALLSGYSQVMPLTEEDIEKVVAFGAVRQLTMLSWLQSRSDIAAFRKRIPKKASKALKYIKNNLDIL